MRILIAILLCSSCQAVTLIRVACGGPGGADTAGNVWSADQGFSGGYSWSAANQPGLGQQAIPYSAMRASSGAPFVYTLTPSGAYSSVTLKFLEPNKTAAGQRVFTATINGQASTVDIFASAGAAMKAFDLSIPVSGTGQITITLTPVTGNAVLSGIQVDGPSAPGTVTSISGLESALPATCPGPGLVFYYTTDPTIDHLWRCSPGRPWMRILHDTPIASVPPPASLIGSNTQYILDFYAAGDATFSVSASMDASGVLGTPVNDVNPALFPNANSTVRPECTVDPADATHHWCIIGMRRLDLAADGVSWVSRSLPANTPLYASIGGAPGFRIWTSNIPSDEVLNESPDASPDGTPIVPTVPDALNVKFNDPKTGAQIITSSNSTDAGGNAQNLYDGANKHMCSSKLVGPGPGFLCSFASDNGAPNVLKYINPKTTEVRYLGKQSGSHSWPSCDAPGVGQLDDLDPTYAYSTASYRTGGSGCPGTTVTVLVRAHYTGDFGVTPVAPNSNAQLVFDLLTPDPAFGLPQLVHAFNPTFDPALFPNCGLDDSFKSGIALVECRMGIQGTPVWFAELDLGDRLPLGQCTNCLHVTGAFFGAANPAMRWSGSHSGTNVKLADGTTINYLVPGGFEGNTQGGSGAAPYLGPYATTLTAPISATDTVLSVAGQPLNMSSLVAPTGLIDIAPGDRLLLCPASTLSAAIDAVQVTMSLVNPAWVIPGMRIDLPPDTAGGTDEVVTATTGGTNPIAITRGSAGTNKSVHASGINAGYWYNDCGNASQLSSGVEMATVTATTVPPGPSGGPGTITLTRDTPNWHGIFSWAAGTNVIMQGGPYRDGSHYLWWKSKAAPNGETAGVMAEQNIDFWGNHGDFGNNMMVTEHYHYRKGDILASINGPTTGTVAPGPAYNGIATPANGNSTSAYPVANKELAPDDWFLDMPGLIGGSNYTAGATPVPGMPNVWKAAFCQGGAGQCAGSPGTLHRKLIPTVAQSGQRILHDVSRPGGTIASGAAGNWTYFVAEAAGEGVAGSVPGDVFFNVPNLTSTGCDNSEGGRPNQFDICIFDAPMGAGSILQMSTTPDKTGWGRRLGSTLSPFGFRLWKELAKSTPDGKLIFFRSGLDKMYMLNAGLLPWIAAKDSYDRTKFIPVKITLANVPAGTVTAAVRFGYQEYGGYGTSRQEGTVSVNTTGILADPPFYFETTDTYTRPPCNQGCSIWVPAMSSRVVMTAGLFYDSNAKLIASVNLAPQVVAPAGYMAPQ